MRFLCGISLTPDFCVSDTRQRSPNWGQKAIVLAKFVPGLAVIARPLAGAYAWGEGDFGPLQRWSGALGR